jgi:hypothetical protein
MKTLTEIMHYAVALAVMAGLFWLWGVVLLVM